MRTLTLDKTIFDNWLNKKFDEAVSKLGKEKISTEEMMAIVLKSQRDELSKLETELKQLYERVKKLD